MLNLLVGSMQFVSCVSMIILKIKISECGNLKGFFVGGVVFCVVIDFFWCEWCIVGSWKGWE